MNIQIAWFISTTRTLTLLLTICDLNVSKWYIIHCDAVLTDILQAILSDLFLRFIHHFCYHKKCPDRKIRIIPNNNQSFLLFSIYNSVLSIFNTFKSPCLSLLKQTNWFLHFDSTLHRNDIYQWWRRRRWKKVTEQSFSLFIIAMIAWSNEHVKHFMMAICSVYTHQSADTQRWQFCLILLMIYFHALAIKLMNLLFLSQFFFYLDSFIMQRSEFSKTRNGKIEYNRKKKNCDK